MRWRRREDGPSGRGAGSAGGFDAADTVFAHERSVTLRWVWIRFWPRTGTRSSGRCRVDVAVWSYRRWPRIEVSYGGPGPQSWAVPEVGDDTAVDRGQATETFSDRSATVERMFDERYRPVRWVDPPIEVRVLAAQLWAPRRLLWGADTPLWQRSGGLQVNEEIPGRLEELIVTSVGDVLGRIRFAPCIGGRRVAEVMLLPWDSWVVVNEVDARRLRELVADWGPG